jgi:uncharacterized membrane-anchored protein
MATIRVTHVAMYEKWGEDDRGGATYLERFVEAVGDVDLEAETVTLVSPLAVELSSELREMVENDLYAVALGKMRERAEASQALADELKLFANDLRRIAACDDRGSEADLGLAVAVAEG